jgi:outer membrane lipoprotein
MNPSLKTIIGLISTLLLFLGCAGTGISKQALSQVSYRLPFTEMQEHPQEFVGEVALLGGKVIDTQTLKGATELTVLQLELDSQHRPKDNDQSKGRFLIVADQFLDPAIYAKGELLTVVGRLEETVTRPIGEREYVYPKLRAVEIKLWKKTEDTSPRFRFGLGIGTSF